MSVCEACHYECMSFEACHPSESFWGFVAAAEKWLEYYPTDIFPDDGPSHDSGPAFARAIRAAVRMLRERPEREPEGDRRR